MTDPSEDPRIDRRAVLRAGIAAGAVGAAAAVASAKPAAAAGDPYADPANPALPPSNMEIDFPRAALVITDPQNDFLHPDGVAWGVVGESVVEQDTVRNIGRLFGAAKAADLTVAVSPHYYYPTALPPSNMEIDFPRAALVITDPQDHGWKFEGALERLMHNIGMFDRTSAYSTEGFEGSGADFLAQYRRYIFDGKTIITSPHKVYGPEQNDLVLQLRKNKVDQVILAGMSANLCTQAHMHELLETGFEVAVVKDATAAAKIPEGDGYLAALTNFRFIANAVWSTDEAVKRLAKGA